MPRSCKPAPFVELRARNAMAPRRCRTKSRLRVALGHDLKLHLFAKTAATTRLDNLKSIQFRTVLLTSIRTVSAKSDASYKAAQLGCLPRAYTPDRSSGRA
ncbi:hypothetical protein MPL3356_460004 [Mesorhizobium plurifarium]|uniref:Uncharacterized protein n=1 Tax=Mesorhizobium plurifarium TaxID=69974 RepID=A0A090EBC0_MESPL|nr:hypothetical protein MPL3356_460004 [Mesorhizobium plurifarium]